MGLLHHLLFSIIHLIIVTMDILLVIILIKVIYDRWQLVWLKPLANTSKPVITTVTAYINSYLTQVTGKSYSEKTLLMLLVLCMLLVRLIICGLT